MAKQIQPHQVDFGVIAMKGDSKFLGAQFYVIPETQMIQLMIIERSVIVWTTGDAHDVINQVLPYQTL